jgi:hypothetical protein
VVAGTFECSNEPSDCIKKGEFDFERLSASQEELCSIELVI